MIRNIIFDIGGVLADFEIVRFLSEKGFDSPTIKRIIKASVLSPYWGKFERAELTEEETLKGFVTMDPEIEQELYTAFSNIEGMLTIRDYAIPLVNRLKARGLRVYYLSNYSRKAYDECGEEITSTGTDENAVLVSAEGAEVVLDGVTVSRTSSDSFRI